MYRRETMTQTSLVTIRWKWWNDWPVSVRQPRVCVCVCLSAANPPADPPLGLTQNYKTYLQRHVYQRGFAWTCLLWACRTNKEKTKKKTHVLESLNAEYSATEEYYQLSQMPRTGGSWILTKPWLLTPKRKSINMICGRKHFHKPRLETSPDMSQSPLLMPFIKHLPHSWYASQAMPLHSSAFTCMRSLRGSCCSLFFIFSVCEDPLSNTTGR